jgi:hypothetical protein
MHWPRSTKFGYFSIGKALKIFKSFSLLLLPKKAILENDQISRSTECEQIRAITDGLKVKIRELIPHVAPKIPGPPSPSCFPPPPFAPPPPPPFPKTHHQSFNGNGAQGEGEGQQQQQEVEFSRVTPKKSSKGMKSFEEAKDEQE